MFFEQNVDFQYFSEKELIKQTCSEINWTLPYIYMGFKKLDEILQKPGQWLPQIVHGFTPNFQQNNKSS